MKVTIATSAHDRERERTVLATVGDLYFRRDTLTTANQRLYIRTPRVRPVRGAGSRERSFNRNAGCSTNTYEIITTRPVIEYASTILRSGDQPRAYRADCREDHKMPQVEPVRDTAEQPQRCDLEYPRTAPHARRGRRRPRPRPATSNALSPPW